MYYVGRKNTRVFHIVLYWGPPYMTKSHHVGNIANDISFESLDTELLEFKKKLGVASSRGRHCPIN